MTTPVDPPRLVHRAELLARLRQVLEVRQRLVLCGPAGSGKSVLLGQLLDGRPEGSGSPDGEVLRGRRTAPGTGAGRHLRG